MISVLDDYNNNNNCYLKKTEESNSLAEYRATVQADLLFIYIFCFFNCVVHFVIGIIWQNVNISGLGITTIKLSYFGGYVVLGSLAIALVMIYNILVFHKQPKITKYMRRFSVVLSVISFVGAAALMIILSIRANDYRVIEDSLARQTFGAAITFTILDVILSIVTLPVFFYIVIINYRSLGLTPEDEHQIQSVELTFIPGQIQRGHHHQIAQEQHIQEVRQQSQQVQDQNNKIQVPLTINLQINLEQNQGRLIQFRRPIQGEKQQSLRNSQTQLNASLSVEQNILGHDHQQFAEHG